MRSDSLLAAPNTLFRLCVRWYALAAVWFMLKFNLRGQNDPSLRDVPAKYQSATRQRL